MLHGRVDRPCLEEYETPVFSADLVNIVQEPVSDVASHIFKMFCRGRNTPLASAKMTCKSWLCLLLGLLLLVSGARAQRPRGEWNNSQRDGENNISPEDDRLMLLAVQNPTVIKVTSDQSQFPTITANVTIGFTSGPNLKPYEYSVKCVPLGASCAAQGSGDGTVYGLLPARKTPEMVSATVTGLDVADASTTFSCYASVYLDSSRKVSKCFSVQTPGPSSCVENELSSTTDWALGCGITNCTGVCGSFGKSCVVNGMRQVDTEQKGTYVLSLFDLPITQTYGVEYPDSPVVDYYSPFRSEFFWNGTISDCDQNGLEPVSRRLCCCGSNCPTS